MNKLIISSSTIALMSIILMSCPIAAISNQKNQILGVWSYRWGPLPNYKKEDCEPGGGTVTITASKIVFDGKFDDKKEKFQNSGSWQQVEDEEGHRAYNLNWEASTDKILLSSNGEVFSGKSGKCYVRGNKQHGK